MARAVHLLPLLLGAALLLPACDSPAFRGPADPVVEAGLTGAADERLPEGFTLANGQGGVRDLSISEENRVTIAAFATVAPPRAIIAFYRSEAEAAGMTYAGRVDAADMITLRMAKADGDPYSIAITALRRGEFTNVTLMFNVVPASTGVASAPPES